MDDPLDLVDDWPVRRLAAALVVDGAVVASRGDTGEVFALASLTKLVTALAVLVAHEEGSVDLDEPVTDAGATLADLLCHAGGIAPDDRRQLVAPRTRRIYSTAGYEVAADVLGEATGWPAADYARAAVAEPLSCAGLELDGSPGAGARGSVDDLVALMAAWRGSPALVSEPTLERARRPVYPDLAGVLPGFGHQDPDPWGLGPEIRGSKRPHWTGRTNSADTYGHFGRSGTFAWSDPRAGVTLVVLTDEPFGPWAARAWPALADAVLATRPL